MEIDHALRVHDALARHPLECRDLERPALVTPEELAGRLLTLDDLQADASVSLGDDLPERIYRVRLTGDMASYEWGVEGEEADGFTLPVRELFGS